MLAGVKIFKKDVGADCLELSNEKIAVTKPLLKLTRGGIFLSYCVFAERVIGRFHT